MIVEWRNNGCIQSTNLTNHHAWLGLVRLIIIFLKKVILNKKKR